MNKWKQSGDCKNYNDHVNEMAKIIYSFLRSDTMSRALASLLCGEGYRKQSEPISCTHENGGEWISVEDRLPEMYEDVLCYADGHSFYVDFICSDGKWCDDESYTNRVTHWMPLPEPPKMKGGVE